MSSRAAIELPEYAGNPFIAALPPVASQREILKALSSPPIFDPKEQAYPATLRRHCVLRLSRMFLPMARQVALAEQIGMQIRQGYVGRNPATNAFIHHLEDGAERIAKASLDALKEPRATSSATSMAFAGCSGAGKSLTVERTLRTYPQLVQHDSPFSLVQIVWIKLDCPTEGSPKQLCIDFFAEVDRLLGTNYLKLYGGRANPLEWMLVRMAQVANLHAIGVLVVDEIQNLRKAAIGSEALLNFLVKLINTVGIPVLAIGTLGALPLFQRNFRQARRATGIGSAIWDRMPRGKEWDSFITSLWQYQWTRETTPLTPEIREVLYDESQGVVDIVVKLFMLAQLRLIAISEVRPNVPDVLKEKLFRQVAKEQLAVVRPMIDALRRNDEKALEKYDDLVPLQRFLDDIVANALGSEGAGKPSPSGLNTNARPPSDDVAAGVTAALTANGVAEDVAGALVADLIAKEGSSDPLLLLANAIERLSTRSPRKPKTKSTDKAKEVVPLPEHDVRRIVTEGVKQGRSGYDSLVNAKVIGPPPAEWAA
jgi:hypothetical protein